VINEELREKKTAKEAAEAAGKAAHGLFRAEFDTDTKDGKTDYVTTADHEAQEAAVEVVRDSFPKDGIVAEEGDAAKTVPEEGRFWVIDPIDGTSNFVRGMPVWTSSVALVVDGEPIASANHMPVLGDIYVAGADGMRLNGDPVGVSDATDHETFSVVPTVWWEHHRRDEFAEVSRRIVGIFGDMLRVGSTQASLSMLASGAVEGVVTNVKVEPWDSVAGVNMVRRGGGVVTGVEGKRWTTNSKGLVASNGEDHGAVLGTVVGL
jgi:Archaeal fructose-1,6-bisphosphatase and related enzymes of inositol monophosphatase family